MMSLFLIVLVEVSRSFLLSFLACRIPAQLICTASMFRLHFFFVNVSMLSLYMRTGVLLVFYCLIVFLLCALCVFRHCWICEVPRKGPVPYSGPRPYSGPQRDFFAPFLDRYFTTQWSTIMGPSPIAVNAPITVHGSWNEKRQTFMFEVFFFFFENERKWDEEGNERRSDRERSGGKWLESSKRSPKRKQESTRQWKHSAPFCPLEIQYKCSSRQKKRKKNSRQKERMQISPKRKVKKTTYVYGKKKLREKDASSYVSRSLSLSLSLSSLSPSLQKESWSGCQFFWIC